MSAVAATVDADEARAKRHLEWERLEQAILARCQCADTKVRGLLVESSPAAAQAALSESGEIMRLMEAGEGLPLHELRETDAHLMRLGRGGVLDGPALADIRLTLRAARAVRRFLKARSVEAPHLEAVCLLDPSLDQLEESLATAIEVDGTLFDHASPDLRKLRAEVSNLRARIIGRIEQLIDKHRDLLSDGYYTIREDRYVVPVRSDAHERFQGIVHATSDSGSSVFVEPSAIVNQGNRLKMAQAEQHREEQRILSELSALVEEHQSALKAAADTLCRFDLRQATAKVAVALNAHVPTLASDGRMQLKNARHPLLVLDGVEVVGNDLALHSGEGLVISGPNAGGKTVLLKTVGLFALMVRAGIPIPASPESVMGFFDPVLTELGDEQSTQHNLSTFSAHVRSLAHIVSAITSSSLVLLDELCGGTDPEEGAALACAIAESLVDGGATVLVTTHYEPLKAFALREPRLQSGSVGFNLDTMEPSFVLRMDVPGASSALSVARRFGIPEAITRRAYEILPQQAKDFEALISQLNRKAHDLLAEQEQLRETRRAVERLKEEHEERLTRLKNQSRRKLSEEAEQVFAELRTARDTLRKVRSELRKQEIDRQALREAEVRVQQISGRLAVGGDLAHTRGQQESEEPAFDDVGPVPDLNPGSRVYVKHLRSEGTVLERDERGRARVAVGSLKLWVDAAGLSGPPADANREPKSQPMPALKTGGAAQGRNPDNTLNLRGMRVDDALPMMESFIDRLLMSTTRQGYIEHGHGSGALKRAVREHLRDSVHHVGGVRPGNDDEGGDAVTAFVLAK